MKNIKIKFVLPVLSIEKPPEMKLDYFGYLTLTPRSKVAR
jgi:hypothetical protein